MTPFFIGIAGGSGTGKTAIAKELRKALGKKASIFYIDNYQKFEEKLPKLCGMENWDHPKSINWDKLLKDLLLLKKGKSVTIKARGQRKLNKFKFKKKSFTPTPIIIIDGYLLFYNASVRKILDFLVFLKANKKTRIKRRTKFKDYKYIQKILLPMHRKYIEPTKKFADLILNTEKYSIRQCSEQITQHLQNKILKSSS